MYVYQIKAFSKGKIKTFLGSNYVEYNFDNRDRDQLVMAIQRIQKLFSTVDLDFILYPIQNSKPVKSNNDAQKIVDNIRFKDFHLISVHGMSSLNMSEDNQTNFTNNLGKFCNLNNLYICDASILPSSTGESPQATIMSLIKNNVNEIKI